MSIYHAPLHSRRYRSFHPSFHPSARSPVIYLVLSPPTWPSVHRYIQAPVYLPVPSHHLSAAHPSVFVHSQRPYLCEKPLPRPALHSVFLGVEWTQGDHPRKFVFQMTFVGCLHTCFHLTPRTGGHQGSRHFSGHLVPKGVSPVATAHLGHQVRSPTFVHIYPMLCSPLKA